MKPASKIEWAEEPVTNLPPGRYYGATGVAYEVTGYDHATDCVHVVRQDNGTIRSIPRPLALSMLAPVEHPADKGNADWLLVLIMAAMAVVLTLIWWSW